MKGYRINPDKKLVNVIMEGLQRKNGHCPCRINVDDTTLCPCAKYSFTLLYIPSSRVAPLGKPNEPLTKST